MDKIRELELQAVQTRRDILNQGPRCGCRVHDALPGDGLHRRDGKVLPAWRIPRQGQRGREREAEMKELIFFAGSGGQGVLSAGKMFSEAVMELREAGKFGELGLSNFPASLVLEAAEICAVRGWEAPTVYEGVYNAFSRSSEALMPTLRAAGMRFAAYNPLAGGLLCGKYHTAGQLPQTGRFADMPEAETV